MPCRPRLCQRFAAQLAHPPPATPGSNNNNHIWISDELLSEAFNAYARVSHSARRYGSNVPGPLEARRRASKRRMGMAVAGAATGPPGGDFGALFGAGNGRNPGQSGWSWQPAGLRLDAPAPPSSEPSGFWDWGAMSSKRDAKLSKQKQPVEYERLLEIPQTGEQVIEASRVAFGQLLRDCRKIERLVEADVAGICDFLKSTADEPEARNITTLVKWLESRSVSATAWSAITMLICDKIELASINDEELILVIRALPEAFDWQKDDSACQQLRDIYAAFSARLLVRNTHELAPLQAIYNISCKIARSPQACADLLDPLRLANEITTCANRISENMASTLLAISRHGGEELRAELLSRLASALNEIPTEIVTEVFGLSTRLIVDRCRAEGFARVHALNWLQCLSAYQSLGGSGLDMNIVYKELAKSLRPSQIAEHFVQTGMETLDLIRMILNTWLPNSDLGKYQDDPRESPNASSGRKELKMLQFSLCGLTAADLPLVADEFESLLAAGEKHPWNILLWAFARTGISYDAIAHEVLDLCKAKYAPPQLWKRFCGMLNHPELTLPSSAAVSLIKHFLALGKPDLAFSIFKHVPSVAFTDVPDLPLAVLGHYAKTRDMFSILVRHPDPVPMEWRATLKLDLTPQQIEFVHLLAYDVANAPVLTPSQAYRSVWACYRWLQDRGAPLKPLISRAIVTAGILRPLQESIWIPDQRLDYILSIVEKVEGAEDALQVEGLAVRMRKAMHEGVLSKRRARFTNHWVRGSHFRAAETRFRLKSWTKKTPLPAKGGKAFWVPFKDAADGAEGTSSSCPSGDGGGLSELVDSFSRGVSDGDGSAGGEKAVWVPLQDTGDVSAVSSRDEDAVSSESVDSFSQRVPIKYVSGSEEPNELGVRWRPNREDSLTEYPGQIS